MRVPTRRRGEATQDIAVIRCNARGREIPSKMFNARNTNRDQSNSLLVSAGWGRSPKAWNRSRVTQIFQAELTEGGPTWPAPASTLQPECCDEPSGTVAGATGAVAGVVTPGAGGVPPRGGLARGRRGRGRSSRRYPEAVRQARVGVETTALVGFQYVELWVDAFLDSPV